MELQSQSNSRDTEIVQDEQKHSAPILSGTHSKGIHKCFQEGCGGKFVASQFLNVLQMRMPLRVSKAKLFQDTNQC